MSMYLESIKRFAPNATQAQVDKFVSHLGIALKNQDGQTVSASDKKELDTIRDGFCTKKLELDNATAEKYIQQVCETLKHDAAKNRVTFYYLLAEKADKLSLFS